MAETPKDGFFKRLGRGFDRYIGGLLGEDLEGMSPEEKAAARRSVIGIIGRGMIDPAQGSEALGAVTQARAQQRAQAEAARRTAAAEAEMPRIAGRLFGGSAGMIETLPGQAEEETRLMTSRYRIDPRDALARLTGTQTGRDVATMAPDLAKLASEGTLGVTVGGSRLYPLTGRYTGPPKEEKPRVQVGKVDLTDRVIVSYSDGTEQTFMKGAAAGARAAGGGGGAGGAAGGGAPGAPGGMFLTPAETAEAGFAPGTIVRRRDGTVVQRPVTTKGGAIPTEGPMAGMTPRQQSGAFQARTAALQYAANITGMSVAEISKKSPQEIEQLIKQKGGRLLQGGLASSLANAPVIGDFMKGVVEAANADLIAPSVGGGSGIAQMQTVGNTMSDMDLAAGQRQFPNPMYPVEVQAQMIRSILERSGGVVEQYDDKGNKVTR